MTKILQFLLKLPGYLFVWYYKLFHGILSFLFRGKWLTGFHSFRWLGIVLLFLTLAGLLPPVPIADEILRKAGCVTVCFVFPYDIGYLFDRFVFRSAKIRQKQGHNYEYAVAKKLSWRGFHAIEVTRASGDFGADILAKKGFSTYAIQCKHYSNPVGVKAVQEALAGKTYYGCDKAMVITNSTFTPAAVELAKKSKVTLWQHFHA